MSWLKLWDGTVFGTECLLKDTSNQKQLQNKKQQFTNKKKFPNKYGMNQWDLQDPLAFATNEVNIKLLIYFLISLGS